MRRLVWATHYGPYTGREFKRGSFHLCSSEWAEIFVYYRYGDRETSVLCRVCQQEWTLS